jgi:hypothetical protein
LGAADRIVGDGYAGTVSCEGESGAGDWAGARGWVPWAGDGISDAGAV